MINGGVDIDEERLDQVEVGQTVGNDSVTTVDQKVGKQLESLQTVLPVTGVGISKSPKKTLHDVLAQVAVEGSHGKLLVGLGDGNSGGSVGSQLENVVTIRRLLLRRVARNRTQEQGHTSV